MPELPPSFRLFQRSYRVWGAPGRLGTRSALYFAGREDLHAQLQVGGCVDAPASVCVCVQPSNVSLLQVFVEEVWLQDAQDRAGGDRTVAGFGLAEDAFGLGRLVQAGPQKAKGPQGKAALPCRKQRAGFQLALRGAPEDSPSQQGREPRDSR